MCVGPASISQPYRRGSSRCASSRRGERPRESARSAMSAAPTPNRIENDEMSLPATSHPMSPPRTRSSVLSSGWVGIVGERGSVGVTVVAWPPNGPTPGADAVLG
jgi:hypothetical protein